jgi:hypothetical protein
MSRPPFQPTEQHRKTVRAMAAYGIHQDDIGRVIGVSHVTLRKHFKEELDLAASEANAKVAEALFTNAIKGNVTAQIWWTKARMGWKETAQVVGPGDKGEHFMKIERVIIDSSQDKNA